MKSLITATFTVTPTIAMAVASIVIYAAGMGSTKALLLLAATGVGALIASALIGIGLAVLADRFGWSTTRLAAW